MPTTLGQRPQALMTALAAQRIAPVAVVLACGTWSVALPLSRKLKVHRQSLDQTFWRLPVDGGKKAAASFMQHSDHSPTMPLAWPSERAHAGAAPSPKPFGWHPTVCDGSPAKGRRAHRRRPLDRNRTRHRPVRLPRRRHHPHRRRTLAKPTRRPAALGLQPRATQGHGLRTAVTSGLTTHEKEQVAYTIRIMSETLSLTVILVEHDIRFIADLCDDAIAINFGKVLARGTPKRSSVIRMSCRHI